MTEQRCLHDLPVATCALCTPRRVTPTCRWCGRSLTDPVSQRFGVGPVCFQGDTTAHAQLLAALDELDEGEALRFGPVSHHTAVEWSNAIRNVDGIWAGIRTRSDGEHVYFTKDGDDQ